MGAVAVRVVPLLGIAVAITTWLRLPRMRIEPALLGLVCWTVGNYVFGALRWRAVSTRGQSWRWYVRVFAEGELLGMLTPAHSGAYLWRLRQLTRAGADRGSAVVEIAADRLSSAVMVVVFALLAGFTVPHRLLPDAALGIGVLAAVAWVTRRWWQPRLALAERPDPRAVGRAALLSGVYQLGYLGFVLGLIAAVGHHVDPLATIGILGLSQAAGLIPGIHGAGPREGAMTGGLVALGMPLSAAVAAVALGAALTWLPAVAVGGSGLAARAWRQRAGTVPAGPVRGGPVPAGTILAGTVPVGTVTR
ncbi:MAG TPA: lysylphosphatidylglycerol synthase domain-containing protein [Mycobacteriales bacterium]|nr:lysylphosphatidylglycerol synthase domain-containing protein [Mycobacteriales bacterium]